MGWFKSLDLAGKVGVALLALMFAGIAVMTASHFIDAAFEMSEQKGAVTERAASQAKTLENVEKANDATNRYRNDPAVRDADCLRDATNAEDC